MQPSKQAFDPAYVDALLKSLTEQRNAALNENAILAAGNSQLQAQVQTLTAQLSAVSEQLKAEQGKTLAESGPEAMPKA